MTWGAIGGAAIGVVGNSLLNSSGGSGGATQTVSKDPWAPAAPWLTSLLGQGQGLQSQYQVHPFNDMQQVGFGNLLQGSDYVNQMTPGLLAQFSQPTGFDRNNPRARPQAYQFPAMLPMKPMYNFLGNSLLSASTPPTIPVSQSAALPTGVPQFGFGLEPTGA